MVTKTWRNRLVPFLCSLNWGGCHLAWLKSSTKLQSCQPVVHFHLNKYNETHRENVISITLIFLITKLDIKHIQSVSRMLGQNSRANSF